MILNPQNIEELQRVGYTIVRSFYSASDLQPLRAELEELGRYIFGDFSLEDTWKNPDPAKRSQFYRVTRYLTSLTRLAAENRSMQVCRDLGLRFPCVMKSFNIRMDTPDNKNLFHWHQDATYLLGSLSGLTFWIPMGTADRTRGSIEVIPGSHRNGFYPFKCMAGEITSKTSLSPQDVRLEEDPVQPATFISAAAGDLVVFSQLLLHRSTPNLSDKVRWTIQLRYADLKEEAFRDAGYPLGDSTNIFSTDYMKYVTRST